MSKLVRRNWALDEGVLSLYRDGQRIVPTADEIFSGVFENTFSDLLLPNDYKALNELIAFSKYPVDLRIILESNEGSINFSIKAICEDGEQATVAWQLNADHVVINNTWYPFIPGIKQEVEAILHSAEISKPGIIKLGQYLALLKTESDFVDNKVGQITSDLTSGNCEEKPALLKATLYKYQETGWHWLSFMRKENIGGILADEMGLGKTLQIISLLASEEKTEIFPSLIVCPTTLLENWRREFAKFAPHISTHIHQGPQRTGYSSDLKKHDVIICAYDTIVRDSSLFDQVQWKIVICDEAQAIKNPETRRAKAVKRIPRQIGFAVTGTPIENRLMDLWSIMDFAVPGFLGSKTSFETHFETGIDGAGNLEHIVTPLILRRRVCDVARDLPSKIIISQVVELNHEEVEAYERIRLETEKEFESNASLVVLTRLRMFCTHPLLLSEGNHADPAMNSNKYARLVEITEEVVANGAKLLIFTSYNRMNSLIIDDFRNRFGIYCNSITGSTPGVERQKVVDEFSSIQGPAVLVLNPIAAGSGLNITSANHVVHYNLEWNPAKEDQASARAYRRGQDRPVTIHRLVYANTIDEVIDDRLTRKRELSGVALIGTQGDKDEYDDILKALNKSPKSKK